MTGSILPKSAMAAAALGAVLLGGCGRNPDDAEKLAAASALVARAEKAAERAEQAAARAEKAGQPTVIEAEPEVTENADEATVAEQNEPLSTEPDVKG